MKGNEHNNPSYFHFESPMFSLLEVCSNERNAAFLSL